MSSFDKKILLDQTQNFTNVHNIISSSPKPVITPRADKNNNIFSIFRSYINISNTASIPLINDSDYNILSLMDYFKNNSGFAMSNTNISNNKSGSTTSYNESYYDNKSHSDNISDDDKSKVVESDLLSSYDILSDNDNKSNSATSDNISDSAMSDNISDDDNKSDSTMSDNISDNNITQLKYIYIISIDKKNLFCLDSYKKALLKVEILSKRLYSRELLLNDSCEIRKYSQDIIKIFISNRNFIFWYDSLVHTIEISTLRIR
jgi:hypothetical protein